MSSTWTEFLVRAFTGGADEMTGDNLMRRVVDGIVAMRTRGRKGSTYLPTEVEVVVTVGGGSGSLAVVRSILEEPGFEEEITQRLQNRLVELPVAAHPMRLYRVVAGDRNRIEVREVTEPVALQLVIHGGNRDGTVLPVPTSQRDLRLGRGPMHGNDSERNDLTVTDEDTFVSRRAARMRRLGGHVRIQSLDQGDALAVVRPNGERIRPNRTIERWAPVRPGDVIELTDGADEAIRLELRPAPSDAAVDGDEAGNTDAPPGDDAEVVVDDHPTVRKDERKITGDEPPLAHEDEPTEESDQHRTIRVEDANISPDDYPTVRNTEPKAEGPEE